MLTPCFTFTFFFSSSDDDDGGGEDFIRRAVCRSKTPLSVCVNETLGLQGGDGLDGWAGSPTESMIPTVSDMSGESLGGSRTDGVGLSELEGRSSGRTPIVVSVRRLAHCLGV